VFSNRGKQKCLAIIILILCAMVLYSLFLLLYTLDIGVISSKLLTYVIPSIRVFSDGFYSNNSFSFQFGLGEDSAVLLISGFLSPLTFIYHFFPVSSYVYLLVAQAAAEDTIAAFCFYLFIRNYKDEKESFYTSSVFLFVSFSVSALLSFTYIDVFLYIAILLLLLNHGVDNWYLFPLLIVVSFLFSFYCLPAAAGFYAVLIIFHQKTSIRLKWREHSIILLSLVSSSLLWLPCLNYYDSWFAAIKQFFLSTSRYFFISIYGIALLGFLLTSDDIHLLNKVDKIRQWSCFVLLLIVVSLLYFVSLPLSLAVDSDTSSLIIVFSLLCFSTVNGERKTTFSRLQLIIYIIILLSGFTLNLVINIHNIGLVILLSVILIVFSLPIFANFKPTHTLFDKNPKIHFFAAHASSILISVVILMSSILIGDNYTRQYVSSVIDLADESSATTGHSINYRTIFNCDSAFTISRISDELSLNASDVALTLPKSDSIITKLGFDLSSNNYSTISADSLLACKYYVSPASKENRFFSTISQGNNGYVYQTNPFVFPCAFACLAKIDSEFTYNGDVFDYQNAIFSYLFADETPIFTKMNLVSSGGLFNLGASYDQSIYFIASDDSMIGSELIIDGVQTGTIINNTTAVFSLNQYPLYAGSTISFADANGEVISNPDIVFSIEDLNFLSSVRLKAYDIGISLTGKNITSTNTVWSSEYTAVFTSITYSENWFAYRYTTLIGTTNLCGFLLLPVLDGASTFTLIYCQSEYRTGFIVFVSALSVSLTIYWLLIIRKYRFDDTMSPFYSNGSQPDYDVFLSRKDRHEKN
jgi:hypothetical protein